MLLVGGIIISKSHALLTYREKVMSRVGEKVKAESSFPTVVSVDPTHKDVMLQLGLLLASSTGREKLVESQRL